MSKKGECYFHKEPWLKETCSKFQVITLSLDALLPKKGPYFLIYFDIIRSLLSNITWNGFWYLLCSVDWVFFCILPIPLVIFPPPLVVVQRGPCGVENHKWPWWSKNELYLSRLGTWFLAFNGCWERRALRTTLLERVVYFQGEHFPETMSVCSEKFNISVAQKVLIKSNFSCVSR